MQHCSTGTREALPAQIMQFHGPSHGTLEALVELSWPPSSDKWFSIVKLLESVPAHVTPIGHHPSRLPTYSIWALDLALRSLSNDGASPTFVHGTPARCISELLETFPFIETATALDGSCLIDPLWCPLAARAKFNL